MTRQLGSLTLDTGSDTQVEWTNQFNWVPVSMEGTRTLGGNWVEWAMPVSKGRPIILEWKNAWISKTDLLTLQSMATSTLATYTLSWDSEIFNVMFDISNGSCMNFTPLWGNYDQFTGTLKLLTV